MTLYVDLRCMSNLDVIVKSICLSTCVDIDFELF